MKHIDFSRPIRLINPNIKKKNTPQKTYHEKILFTKKVTWLPDPKRFHDSPTRQRSQIL